MLELAFQRVQPSGTRSISTQEGGCVTFLETLLNTVNVYLINFVWLHHPCQISKMLFHTTMLQDLKSKVDDKSESRPYAGIHGQRITRILCILRDDEIDIFYPSEKLVSKDV